MGVRGLWRVVKSGPAAEITVSAPLGGEGGDVAADAAGGPENGDVHGCLISCSAGAG